VVAQATRAGRLDLLVNNAAVNIERPIAETDDAHWDQHLAVILRAGFFTVRAALPLLKASEGSVVNIASELGLHAIANNVAYVAAKHGVLAMTRALAIELAPDKVRVNALCPGTMDTELMRDCAAASGDPAAYYGAFTRYHPMGRLASPEEIAAFVLCLASPAAAFMTGAAIAIDGGSTAGRI
jgi:NAD(P)-dependent dehydrogenase (short-subunit alcohol dehydrogenase family)